VNFADAVRYERQVPIVIEQPGCGPGGMGGEPLAVPEEKELILPAVQHQQGDGDIGQLEPPAADVGARVVPPSLAARRESLMVVVGQA
jgi:hypothetical protein